MVAERPIKTICLFGPGIPPYFKDEHPGSQAIERCAIDIWNAGFGTLAVHLNVPRDDGLVIPEGFQLSFDACAIKKFADAVFVMPGWEREDSLWVRVLLAQVAKKPVFDSLYQLVRWREGEAHACVTVSGPRSDLSNTFLNIRALKVAFVVGKYFVGEKKGEQSDVLVPDRNAIHQNIIVANRVSVMLLQEQVYPFTPHNNTHHFELKTRVDESTYQAFDQLLLERLVDGLVVLQSWVNSTGGRAEVVKAQSLNLPVIDAHDLQSIRNWRDDKKPINIITTITE